MKLHWRDFVADVETLVRNHVRLKHPYNWDENHITMSLLEALRNRFSELTLTGFSENLEIRCEAYKYNRPEEYEYGDIGIYVHFTRREGPSLEGAAFLEAKKRTDNRTTFDELKGPQLKTIISNAPHAMVLLYDYADIVRYPTNRPMPNRPMLFSPYTFDDAGEGLTRVSTTNAVVAPANFVYTNVKTGRKGKQLSTLYRSSLPFSHQLCFRYFHGFDLEYSKEAVDVAKGYATRCGWPPAVLVFRIREEGAIVDQEPQINRDFAEEL